MITEDWEDLGMRLEMEPSETAPEHVADFRLFDTNQGDELLVSGSVKWDGCANFAFNNANRLLHACERQDLLNIGIALARVHDRAASMIPRADWKAPE